MPSGPLPLSCSGLLNALCALTVGSTRRDSEHFIFNWSPHLSFHWLLLFYLSRFPLCPVSVLVLLTMNSRLQTRDWASVPCVRSVEMTENIEAVWVLRVWGLCRADIFHTEQSLFPSAHSPWQCVHARREGPCGRPCFSSYIAFRS